MSLLTERLQFIKGIDPVADAFDSTQSTDVVDMAEFERVIFLSVIGVGATGSSTVTIEACDDIVPTNTVAIGYMSRDDHQDAEGAITARAAAGYIPTVGSSRINSFEVDQQALAASGYRYVRAKFVESVNSPVLGGVVIIGEKRAARAINPSAID